MAGRAIIGVGYDLLPNPAGERERERDGGAWDVGHEGEAKMTHLHMVSITPRHYVPSRNTLVTFFAIQTGSKLSLTILTVLRMFKVTVTKVRSKSLPREIFMKEADDTNFKNVNRRVENLAS